MFQNSSPYHSKSTNYLSTSATGSFSATKLTNFGAESNSPVSPYKARHISSATKTSYINELKGSPVNREELESEIKDHIKALKDMRTELGKQKSFIIAQMDPTPKSATTTNSRSYLNYDTAPIRTTIPTSTTPIERTSFLNSDFMKRSSEMPLKANHEIQSTLPASDRNKPVATEAQKSKKFEQVYNEIMGNVSRVKDSEVFKNRPALDSGKTHSQERRDNFSSQGRPDFFSGGPTFQRSSTMGDSGMNRSSDFTSRPFKKDDRFDIGAINKTEVPKSSSTTAKNSFINLSRDERSSYTINPSSIYTRDKSTPEMSPRYHLLQREISGRYQRTKDMLEKVVLRSGSLDRTEGQMSDRVRTEPVEYTREPVEYTRNTEGTGEERQKTAHARGGALVSEEDRNPNMTFSNRVYYEEQPKKQGPAGRYEEVEDNKFKEEEEKRIYEYQKIIEELQGRIQELETAAPLSKRNYIDVVKEESEHSHDSPVKAQTREISEGSPDLKAFSPEGEKGLRQQIREITQKLENYQKENGELKTQLKNQENTQRLNQSFLRKHEEEKEKLEQEKSRLERINAERNKVITELDNRIREMEEIYKAGDAKGGEAREKIKVLQKELEEKSQAVKALEAENLKTQKQAEEHAKVIKSYKETESSRNEDASAISQENQRIKQELAKLKDKEREFSQIKEDLQAKEKVIRENEERINRLTADVENFTIEQSKLEVQKSELNLAKQLLHNPKEGEFLVKLEALVKQCEDTQNGLKEEKEKAKLLKSKSIEETQILEQKVKEIEEEKTSKEEEITKLNQKLVETEKQLSTVTQELEGKVQSAVEVNSKYKNQIEELSQTIKTLESSSDSKTQTLSEKVKAYSQEKEALEKEVKNLQKQNEDLVQELKTSKDVHKAGEENLANKISQLEKEVEKQKELLGHANTETAQQKGEFERQLNQLKDAKREMSRQLEEKKGFIEISQNEYKEKEKHFESEAKDLEEQRNTLSKALEQRNSRIQELEGEIDHIKVNVETLSQAKKSLEKELGELKEKDSKNQLTFSQEVNKFQQNIGQIQEENSKLKQELKVSSEKIQGMAKDKSLEQEHQKIKQDLVKKDSSIQELEGKVQGLTQERETQNQKIGELQQEITVKEKQIEGLKYDINQMKGYLLQHHGDTIFGKSELDEEQKSEIISEIKFPVATSEASFNQDVSFRGSEWETGSKKDSPTTSTRAKNSKKMVLEGYTEYIADSPASRSKPLKSKRDRESDPVHSRYEKMIRELTEKLAAKEKAYKKEIETKVLESSKLHVEKEGLLLQEIEDLKKENKTLVKKIEDIEWEKAYEYTDKKKKELSDSQLIQQAGPAKIEEKVAANGEGDAKKKKKKKKKKAKNDQGNEADSDKD